VLEIMQRRNRENVFEEDQTVERWLISYADFITLLFAFFVVMYSISQVNEGKYRSLSESLDRAFDTPQKSIQPIEVGEFDGGEANDFIGDSEVQNENLIDEEENDKGKLAQNDFESLEQELKESLKSLIDAEVADVSSDGEWINVNLSSGLLFPSGSDSLNDNAGLVLAELSMHLNSNNQKILVHGHTDNISINTEKFPSNWELSSARASAVVRKLQELSVYGSRMSVEGHGEFSPVASNDTSDGRAKNRRVVIAISREISVEKIVPEAEDITTEATMTEQNQVQNTIVEGRDELSPAEKEAEPEFEIVRLPGGGILIRGKKLPQKDNESGSK